MGNFTFYAPTRVYFGRKEEEQIGSILKQEGCHRGTGALRWTKCCEKRFA